MLLPNLYNIQAASGSQYAVSFVVQNDNNTLADLTNKTFEFVVRNRMNLPNQVLFSVSSTASTANGHISVNLTTATVSVVINPVAVALITEGGGPYTMWMDPGLSDATALTTGVFYTLPTAAP